jgi:hypothetical protein
MAYSHYERLSALDTSFLSLEDRNTHMHIGAVAIFEAAPLTRSDGGIDFDRIQTAMEAGIHRVPRYRQRLAWMPVVRHPVWVDDATFNLHYHLRHTHLPQPGDARHLKRLAGRLMSQQLDRGKPLWEMWIVEGLASGGLAMVSKIHHCMIDGVGSAELTASIMRPTPDPALGRPPPRWVPRPVPRAHEFALGELGRRGRQPFALLRAARARARGHSTSWSRTCRDRRFRSTPSARACARAIRSCRFIAIRRSGWRCTAMTDASSGGSTPIGTPSPTSTTWWRQWRRSSRRSVPPRKSSVTFRWRPRRLRPREQMHWSLREAYLFDDGRGCAVHWHPTFRRPEASALIEIDGMDFVEVRGDRISRNEICFDRAQLAPFLMAAA